MLNTVYFLCQPYGKPFFPGALTLLLKNGIRNQALDAECVPCYWNVVTFRSSQLTESGNICAYTYLQTFLYVSKEDNIFIFTFLDMKKEPQTTLWDYGWYWLFILFISFHIFQNKSGLLCNGQTVVLNTFKELTDCKKMELLIKIVEE